MINVSCANGCCVYKHKSGAGHLSDGHWTSADGGRRVNFCPVDGGRLCRNGVIVTRDSTEHTMRSQANLIATYIIRDIDNQKIIEKLTPLW